jgi:hypothetical protein
MPSSLLLLLPLTPQNHAPLHLLPWQSEARIERYEINQNISIIHHHPHPALNFSRKAPSFMLNRLAALLSEMISSAAARYTSCSKRSECSLPV